MTHIIQKHIVHKNIQDTYNIIANVENYPSFIPLISSVKLLRENENIKDYELSVKFPPLTQTFSTRDIFYKNEKIQITLLNGPFEKLNNIWLFKQIDVNTTEIIFEIDFEFKSALLSKMFSSVFEISQKKILSYFLNEIHKN